MRSWRTLGRWAAALVVTTLLTGVAAAGAQADQEALLVRLRELMEATGQTRLVMPAPGSRSVVLAVDASTPLYFFLERGSIRGSAIDDFYDAYDAGNVDAAFDAFRASALPTIRVTDYGWNGLGVPLVTDSGSEVGDILYRSVEGTFARAPRITREDIDAYVSYIELVIQALEGS